MEKFLNYEDQLEIESCLKFYPACYNSRKGEISKINRICDKINIKYYIKTCYNHKIDVIADERKFRG